MALVACDECSREISTKVKKCPHCGAKNRNSERSKALWLLIVIVVGFLLWLVLNPMPPEAMIPECWNDDGKERFIHLFDNSQYAQLNKLHVIDVTDQIDVSPGPQPIDRVCEATLRLNNGEITVYTFSFELSPSGTVIIKGAPK